MNDNLPVAVPSKLLSFLRLLRLPNVFTALADIAMGFVVVNGKFEPVGPFVSLLVATGLLYTAGMVLNDVYDVEIDRVERPKRPLPAGQISLNFARMLGFMLLGGGLVAAWLAGFVDTRENVIPWKSGMVATLLAACILGYDGYLKKTAFGPLAMGACRFFNVLLGMSVAPRLDWKYDAAQLAIAVGIAVYIVGVTYFARTEATESNRRALGGAVLVMALGLSVLAGFPRIGGIAAPAMYFAHYHWLVALLSLPIILRCLYATNDPSPRNVQTAVKNCIFSLIILDASVALAIAGPAYGIAIVALWAPMNWLGRWVYAT